MKNKNYTATGLSLSGLRIITEIYGDNNRGNHYADWFTKTPDDDFDELADEEEVAAVEKVARPAEAPATDGLPAQDADAASIPFLRQRHTHEFLGSTLIAEAEEDPHNHRFAGVTGEAIYVCGGEHFHRLKTRTDFYEDHFHYIVDRTGPAVYLDDGRHVHYVEGYTSFNDEHRHEFRFATLIDNPIGECER